MKKLLILIIPIISLISCSDFQKDNQQQTIDDRILSELETGLRYDTIFLGFRFGMTKLELQDHLEKLKKGNKIYLNSRNIYEYEFDFTESSLIKKGLATFSSEYHENKLYKFSISVVPEGLVINRQMIQLKLAILYISKYGNGLEKKSLLSDGNSYIWINGNRMIEIVEGISDVRIFYTDLIAENDKEKIEKNKEKQKKDI